MRLDARNGACGWFVWHVPTCKHMTRVVWVDDELAQYGAWPSNWCGIEMLLAGLEPPVTQAKRVLIVSDKRLVLIDPLDDYAPDAETVPTAQPQPIEA